MALSSNNAAQRQLYAPKSYYATFVTMQGLAVAGFVPAVVVYLRKSRWWLNPIIQPPAWGNPNTLSMSYHAFVSSAWIGIAILQLGITGIPNYLRSHSNVGIGGIKINTKSAHRVAGYLGLAMCLGMNASGIVLTAQHGVAGKVTNNGFAWLAGFMTTYHILKGISAVRRNKKEERDINTHLWHMTGLFAWTCFPGLGRSLGILAVQQFMLGTDKHSTDVVYTSGWAAQGFIATGIGHFLLNYFLFGPLRFKPRMYMSYYALYAIGAALDVAFGLIDGSLYKASERPLLAQVPGQPWVLETTPK